MDRGEVAVGRPVKTWARRSGSGRSYQFELSLSKGAYDSEIVLEGTGGCEIVQQENDKFALDTDYPVSIPGSGDVGPIKQDAINSGGNVAWHLRGSQRGCSSGSSMLSDCKASDDIKLNPKRQPVLAATERKGKLAVRAETITGARVQGAQGSWDQTNNGGSCGDAYNGAAMFYPAGFEPDNSSFMPQMLSMRFSVSLKALRGLRRGQKLTAGNIHVADSDHPPLGCSGSFGSGTCSEHVMWDGRVVVRAVK